MNISIIIPFYKGDQYVQQLLDMLEQAIDNFKEKFNYDVEIIIINDYPSDIEKVRQFFCNTPLNVCIYNNRINYGIQKSRINGLKYSKYNYIVFLDQDDIISKNYLINQISNLENNDVIISNGFYEGENTQKKIYKSIRSIQYACKEIGYLKVRDLIVSPGQCLIKKDSIPKYWIDNIMKVNCADDYFLWLLMFNNNSKFTYNYSLDYTHKYTGINLSDDLHHVHKSNLEMISLLKKNNGYPLKKIKILEKTIYFKYNLFIGHKLFNMLKNLNLTFYNIIYQIFWKGM